MALSLGNRQPSSQAITTKATNLKAQRHNDNQLFQKWSGKKQNSFIEIGSSKVLQTGNTARSSQVNTQRPLTVCRSINNLQQKILMPLAKQRKSNGSALSKQYSIDRLHSNVHAKTHNNNNNSNGTLSAAATTTTAAARNLRKNFSYCDALFDEANEKKNQIIQKQNAVWSQVNASTLITTATPTTANLPKLNDVKRLADKCNKNGPNTDNNLKEHTESQDTNNQRSEHSCQHRELCLHKHNAISENSADLNKISTNKINLNIVLTQTIKATTEHEFSASDAEGSFDINETKAQIAHSERKVSGSDVSGSATNKRAQFHISRGLATTTIQAIGTPNAVASPAATNNPCNNNNPITASPSLIIKKRPPLVRAMSAPVRSFDENSKNILGTNKRKPRRRKLNARTANTDKSPDTALNEAILLDCESGGNKKQLSRARTVAAPDVITLVSLVSSEGSDSEREDNSGTASATNSETTPPRRAPLLRKTGKSVSFQENFPPNFQLATKEYSHMLRRGSILPLAARLRLNRPPTAPPVSIFLTDAHKTNSAAVAENKPTQGNGNFEGPTADKKEHTLRRAVSVVQIQEYDYPSYVRSLKERECWKLYRKMCDKGVNVAYDTIARGMLTPTEFRQLQKQREQEEDKARAAAEEANNVEEVKKPASAIERLSEALLKKK